MTSIKLINWNTQGDNNPRDKHKTVQTLLTDLDADIICLTEAYHDYLPQGGYAIDAGLSGWGYDAQGGRKVILCSKADWQQVDAVGDSRLPTGRYLSAYHPAYDMHVIGVCIPWAAYRNPDITENWAGHKLYTRHLTSVLQQPEFQQRTLLMGDFNMRIGAKSMQGSSIAARDGVLNALKSNAMTVATAGIVRQNGDNLLDHIATTPDLTVKVQSITDHPLSDHPIVIAEI